VLPSRIPSAGQGDILDEVAREWRPIRLWLSVTKTISVSSCCISLRLAVLRPFKIHISREIRTPFEWRTLVFPGFQSLELYRSLLTLRALFTDIRWRAGFAGPCHGFALRHQRTTWLASAGGPGLLAPSPVIRTAPEKTLLTLNTAPGRRAKRTESPVNESKRFQ